MGSDEKIQLIFFPKYANFLYRKFTRLRKQAMQAESQFTQQVAAKLETQRDLFDPLQVSCFRIEPRLVGSDYAPDATLELGWKGRFERFQVEIKSRTAPSLIQAAISKLERYGQTGQNLMLLVPYLSKTITGMLTQTEFSCVDLNGNYLIQTNDWLAIRLDKKNQFTESSYIKKIFEGKSSLVCRLLLRENRAFSRVSEIYDGIRALGGNLSLSAVSKVLAALDEQLLIDRSKTSIRLLQPRRLLEELRANYKAPKTRASVKLKLPEGRNSQRILTEALGNGNWIWTGESSAERYTVTTPATNLSVYTGYSGKLENVLSEYENPRFYNCTVGQTVDPRVYFDRQGNWSSKLQCYLELSNLDKREREIARDIEGDILGQFNETK
jgi:hypothetical protein